MLGKGKPENGPKLLFIKAAQKNFFQARRLNIHFFIQTVILSVLGHFSLLQGYMKEKNNILIATPILSHNILPRRLDVHFLFFNFIFSPNRFDRELSTPLLPRNCVSELVKDPHVH